MLTGWGCSCAGPPPDRLDPPGGPAGARELVRHRINLVWLRSAVRNRLLSRLARRNLQPTRVKSWLTQGGQRELRALALAPSPATIRDDCLTLLPLLDTQIRRLDAELLQRWGEDPRVQRLTTIPGIGPFIAIVLVLELGDIARFPSAKHVASDIGLTPRVRASADRVRSGHITREGNRLLRWVLVLAATQAVAGPVPCGRGSGWFSRAPARNGPAWPWRAASRNWSPTVWKDEVDYWTILRRGAVRG